MMWGGLTPPSSKDGPCLKSGGRGQLAPLGTAAKDSRILIDQNLR